MPADRLSRPEILIGPVLLTEKSAPIRACGDEPTNFSTKSG
jgi:hypothetical protein